MTTAQQIHTLLSHLSQRTQPSGGMLFFQPLQQANLDYFPASITRLSHLLSQLANKGYPLAQLITQPKATPFFLTVAGYLAQYIAQTTDESIRWLSYGEAQIEISKKNREYGTDFHLEKNFDSSFIADIGEGMFCQPLMAIRMQLQGQGRIEAFIAEMQQAIFSRTHISLDQPAPIIAQQYLNKVRTGKLLDTQVGFYLALQTIEFDFSVRSLTQMDTLLNKIARQLSQAGIDYDHFIAEPIYQRFCYVVGVYVGATVAKLRQLPIRWTDYHHAKMLFKQPDLPYSLEYSLVMVTPTRYYTPLLVVTNALFALTATDNAADSQIRGYPATAHDFLSLVTQETTADLQKSATLPLQWFNYPTLLSKPPDLTLPPQWQSLMQLAGNVLANHIFQIFDGNAALAQVTAYDTHLTPQQHDDFGNIDTHAIQSAAQTTHMLLALEQLYTQLIKNPHNAAAQIASYSSQLTLPTLTVACIMLEIRHYAEPTLSLQLILPYRPAQTVAGFALYPLLYQPMPQSLPESTVLALVQTVYQQASQFKSPMHSGNFWENYYVAELGSDHLSPYQSRHNAQPIKDFEIRILPLVDDIDDTISPSTATTCMAATDTTPIIAQPTLNPLTTTALTTTALTTTPRSEPKISPISPSTPEVMTNATSDIHLKNTLEPTTFATDHQILQSPATLSASLQEQLRQDQLRLKTSLSDSDTGKERKLIMVGLVIGVIIAVVMLMAWLKK